MLPGLCWGAAGAGGAGGLRGARGERTGVMDEASRGLSKGSLKRFLGVLCHPGASPAPLAEPALAAGGSCASSSGTWEQTPLFSAALGAAEPPARGAGAGSEQHSRCPGRNRGVPAGRHRFPFAWERVFGSEGCGERGHLCRAPCGAALRAQPGGGGCAPVAVPGGFSGHSQWDAPLRMPARPWHRWAQRPGHEVAAIESLLPMEALPGVQPGTGAPCHVNYFS